MASSDLGSDLIFALTSVSTMWGVTTKMSVVRPFSVLTKTKLALSKTGCFLSKAEILGVGVFSPLPTILKFRIGFAFGENSAGFCQSVWLPELILNFRIGSVSSIGGLIAATLFADTISDPQKFGLTPKYRGKRPPEQ